VGIEIKHQFQLIVLLFCVGTCRLISLNAQGLEVQITQEPPLWAAETKQFGYEADPSRVQFRVGSDPVKIQFLNDGRLALAWITADEVAKKRVAYPSNVPAHLYLSILDAKTGHQVSSHRWACHSWGVTLAYTATGQWIVTSDESVTLYSPSFEKVKELQLAKTQPFRLVSPSGHSILLFAADGGGRQVPEMFDATTFEVTDSWQDLRFDAASFIYSDRFILAQTRTPRALFIREIGNSWISFSMQVDPKAVNLGLYEFLNDDTLVKILGAEITVEKVQGSELFTQPAPERGLWFSSWQTSAVSRDGNRFAAVLDRTKGLRSPKLDMYPYSSDDRVVVYSVPRRSAIFSVHVKGTSPWYPRTMWNRIAISRDGLLLGIVSNEGVRVFNLPSDLPNNN
jgi:hypothetical protein